MREHPTKREPLEQNVSDSVHRLRLKSRSSILAGLIPASPGRPNPRTLQVDKERALIDREVDLHALSARVVKETNQMLSDMERPTPTDAEKRARVRVMGVAARTLKNP
jgi:hypothetical protein